MVTKSINKEQSKRILSSFYNLLQNNSESGFIALTYHDEDGKVKPAISSFGNSYALGSLFGTIMKMVAENFTDSQQDAFHEGFYSVVDDMD